MAQNLQPTYGSFKLYGEVQGLSRKFAYNDQNTKSGKERQQLRFQVKTNEDNIVDVQISGFKFENILIQPQDFEDKRSDKLPYTNDVYEKIPEGWQVMMGVSAGIEQDKDSNNIRVTKTGYDMAKYVYKNLKDGDVVFISGRTNFNSFTDQQGNERINDNLEIQRIFKSSKEFDYTKEDFKEMSSFSQKLIINAMDLDKKEKVAHLSAYIVQNKQGDLTPYDFWIDGNKYDGLVKNLRKLPFGTQMKVEGHVHSHPVYEDVEEDDSFDGWGERSEGYAPRQSIAGVEKSFEITFGDPETIEEEKYTEEDLFPPKEEKEDNTSNPFMENESDNDSSWGSKSDDDSTDNTTDNAEDPFADMDSF